MPEYLIKLTDRRPIVQDTMAFIFEKPGNFSFKAGQFGDFTLINPPETDAEGNMRMFTFASPPYAGHIMIVTRMRNTAFKRMIKTLPVGLELRLKAPLGNFTLHSNPEIPAVFLSGGIGVTPARSILRQAAYEKLPHKLYLFYSNHSLAMAFFLEEFKALEKINRNFKFVATMTKMEKSIYGWNGETDHIDQSMLEKYIGDLSAPIYYISGPSNMVEAMHTMLKEAGIARDKIRMEKFIGY